MESPHAEKDKPPLTVNQIAAGVALGNLISGAFGFLVYGIIHLLSK